jgi:hypothetical protein
MPKIDSSILEMALVGLQSEAQKIEAAMAAIRKRLGVRGKRAAVSISTDGAAPRRKRHMSAAALKRIVAAQKKRWAAYHAKQGATAKKAAPKKTTAKRTMSPERRAALAANLAKARTARAAKKAAA